MIADVAIGAADPAPAAGAAAGAVFWVVEAMERPASVRIVRTWWVLLGCTLVGALGDLTGSDAALLTGGAGIAAEATLAVFVLQWRDREWFVRGRILRGRDEES